MTIFSYRTIATPAEGNYKEKGSKFLSFAFPVASEKEVKSVLEALRKRYFDARHHCYAYVLGADQKIFRANDDGEPNHSAGDPILGQIRSKDLTDIVIVVVRYFGGTKLGVGGLISAYRAAAEDALSNAHVTSKDVLKEISVRYDYSETPEVMKLIKDFELAVKEQSFDTSGFLRADYKLERENRLFEKIKLLQDTGHVINLA